MAEASSKQLHQIQEAFKQLAAAAQNLANVLDENEYEFLNVPPVFLHDVEDFAYDVTVFVEDEVSSIDEINAENSVHIK